jgi:hypothetical protein
MQATIDRSREVRIRAAKKERQQEQKYGQS